MNSADLEAARLLLQRLDVRPEDLLTAPTHVTIPTFGEYVPQVVDAAPAGARRTYLPYWQKLSSRWPDRSIADPTGLELQQLVEHTRRHAIVRRNSREGRSAAEHMVGAIRRLYRHAVASQYIPASRNPAAALDKPRRQRSSRRALSARQLTQINHVAATTGDDPDLDTLLLRLHLETACRTGSALRLRPEDIDPDHSQIRLFGKGAPSTGNRYPPPSPLACSTTAVVETTPASNFCDTDMGAPSPAAATTTSGNASAATCPGSPPTRSPPTGYATPPSPGSNATTDTPSPVHSPPTPNPPDKTAPPSPTSKQPSPKSPPPSPNSLTNHTHSPHPTTH
ncbi:site-specific integrase [Nocardia asiatica]|uniref:site-specific integrase n=1 Tax=Nocardia asiatica TaxID=209252 RepID=UPI0003065337|nr:site-specific integrase [Nocardia asiatica]